MDDDLKGYAMLIGRSVHGIADQHVYRLTPPHEGYEYVTVLTAAGPDRNACYILGAAGPSGRVVSHAELRGSMYDMLDPAEALRAAGYVLYTDLVESMRAVADAGLNLQEQVQVLRDAGAQVVAAFGRMVAERGAKGGEP